MSSSWWGCHYPNAEACGDQEYNNYVHDVFNTDSDWADTLKSSTRLKRTQTRNRTSSYTWKLEELLTSGHQQDIAVEVPIESYL